MPLDDNLVSMQKITCLPHRYMMMKSKFDGDSVIITAILCQTLLHRKYTYPGIICTMLGIPYVKKHKISSTLLIQYETTEHDGQEATQIHI